MKLLLTISFALYVLAVNCQTKVLTKDYLVVFDANSKKFLQISLDSNNSVVELPRTKQNNSRVNIPRLIIEHNNDIFRLYYVWFNELDLGMLENSKEGITENVTKISRTGIRDFAMDPSHNVLYFTSFDLYKRNLSENDAQKIADAAQRSSIPSLNYNPKEEIIYFYECPSTGIFLRRMRASDNKVLDPIKLNQCLGLIYIDFQAQELFGTYGSSIYSTKLDDKPNLKIIHDLPSDSNFGGFAIGSKHLYYTIVGQNVVYKLERNSSKVEKFYEYPNGKFEALALFEGDAISPNSSGSKSVGVIGLLMCLLVVFM